MFETIIVSAFTAIAGAIASIWSYWTGRKKTASENAIKRSEALDKMNEIIDKQAGKLEQLYEVVTGLRSENAKLILQNDTLKNSVEQLNKEVEALRKELSLQEATQGARSTQGTERREQADRPQESNRTQKDNP